MEDVESVWAWSKRQFQMPRKEGVLQVAEAAGVPQGRRRDFALAHPGEKRVGRCG